MSSLTGVSIRQLNAARGMQESGSNTIATVPARNSFTVFATEHERTVRNIWESITTQTSNVNNNKVEVKIDEKWQEHPKHYQYMSDEAAYEHMKTYFPELESIVSFTRFVALKPFFVKKGKFSLAMCIKCLNIQYLLKAFAQSVLAAHKQRHTFRVSQKLQPEDKKKKICNNKTCTDWIEKFAVSTAKDWGSRLFEKMHCSTIRSLDADAKFDCASGLCPNCGGGQILHLQLSTHEQAIHWIY